MSSTEPEDEITLGYDYVEALRQQRSQRPGRMALRLAWAVSGALLVFGLLWGAGGGSWMGVLYALALLSQDSAS